MPVLTRSCGREGLRSRIEDPTPKRSCRTTGLGRVKRKIIEQADEAEPPAKKIIKRATTDKRSSSPDAGNAKDAQKPKRESKIPRRCTTTKTKPATKVPQVIEPTKMKETETAVSNQQSPVKINNKQCTPESTPTNETRNNEEAAMSGEQSPTQDTQSSEDGTPKSAVSARTRTYSALKRSLNKKNSDLAAETKPKRVTRSMRKLVMNGNGERSRCSSPTQGQTSSMSTLEDKESGEMEEKESDECQEVFDSSAVTATKDREEPNAGFYKDKFHVLLQSLKEIQTSFKNAQDNAQQNLKAYDTFIQELKKSLTIEQDKTTTLDHELRETKEALDQARKEIENIKTSTAYTKDNSICNDKSEKQDQEKPTENSFQSNSSDKVLTKFYSMLTGISLTPDDPETTNAFESYSCVYEPKGTNKHVSFRLVYDKEFDEFEYSPTAKSPRSKDMMYTLPKYLQESIYFTPDQAPTFLARLLKSVQNLKR